MKKIILFCIMIILFNISFAQIKDINGKIIDYKTLVKSDELTLVCFFATWCKPCIKELNTLDEYYKEWNEETGIKIIIISIDNSRSINSVKPLVDAKDWSFDVYLDPNSDYKRYLNVNNIPQSFLFKNGKIVYSHSSYLDGDEKIIYENIKKFK